MTAQAELRDAADTASEWLFRQAMPLWLEHGVDWRRGGFFEALDLVTLENRADFKRLRVTTRQIYVFVEGALAGVPRADEAVDHGLAFLLGPVRNADGGFASRCDLDGRIVDPTRDLYDLAFTLFALAHAHRLTGDARLKAEARALLDFVAERLRHPAGGFAESIPPVLPRRQNPHMHLLEAALACAEHIPDAAFDTLCDELAELAQQRFLDAGAGLLREYYADDLTPVCDAQRRALIEPGHHFEWAWLLTEYARIRGRGVPGGHALARTALRHGLDPATGLLRGELFDDGTVADGAVRVWPHGEWLKAALALPGTAGDPLAAWAALRRFLDAPTTGLWREQWDPASACFSDKPAPASTLYHITTAVMELRSHAARVPA
jgi:mannose/cellobiose epimerase-like protein (N-acyl-D-glucosamine 2-epimerase family)